MTPTNSLAPRTLGAIAACLLVAAAAGWVFGAANELIKLALVGAAFCAAVGMAVSPLLRSFAFTGWVTAFIITAFSFPQALISWGSFELAPTIGPLVQVIMLGMGMTLTFNDFARVLRMPRGVFIGASLQFLVMPLGAYFFAALFGLRGEVAAGLILIGSCPGGTASNVLVYIARGNVPLSVSMTAVSTLLSPIMTPLMMKLLAGQYIPVEAWPMMISILQIILIPMVIGIFINRYLPGLARWAATFLPAVAMGAICMIIGITIALARDQLLVVGLTLFGAAACHNATGYVLGYWGGRFAGLDRRDSRTVAFEVGIQNGGMATGLALGVMKSPIVAMGSAVFGPWSAITSSIMASIFRRSEVDPEAVVDVPTVEGAAFAEGAKSIEYESSL